MKKFQVLIVVLCSFFLIFSFKKSGTYTIEKFVQNHKYYPDGNKLVGYIAGAPNEFNCTACHSGNTQSGAGINMLTVTTDGTNVTDAYLPNNEYIINLSMSNNPVKKGFEAVAMNSANQIVGTVTLLNDGLVSVTGSNLNHPHHTLAGSTNATSVWSWKWKAPNKVDGVITFYVSSLSANNDASSNNDIVYLSQHTISPDPKAGIKSLEKNEGYDFKAIYSMEKNAIAMNFNSKMEGEMFFNLVDISGKSVFNYKMGTSVIGQNHEEIILPNELNTGIYMVNMFVHNNAMQQKIMIQK